MLDKKAYGWAYWRNGANKLNSVFGTAEPPPFNKTHQKWTLDPKADHQSNLPFVESNLFHRFGLHSVALDRAQRALFYLLYQSHCPSGEFQQDWTILSTEKSKVWVAKVRARMHTCDVRSHVCVRNPFWKVCGMCVRAAHFWVCDVRPYFLTLLEQNCHKIVWKPILEHPIPF